MQAYNPKAFWYSKLNDYRFCPAYYEARHLKGIVPDAISIDLDYGTALHMGVNDILQGGDGLEVFNIYWESVKDKAYPKSRYSWDTLKMNGEVHLTRFIRLHMKKFEPFKMEERIFQTIDGTMYEGTPDFLGSFDGVPSIVDFKTTGSNYVPEKIIAEEQLSFYAALAEAQYNYVPKRKSYFIFKKDQKEPSIQKALTSELTSVDICSTLRNVKLTVDEIQTVKQFPKNTQNCVRGTIVCPNFKNCWSKK